MRLNLCDLLDTTDDYSFCDLRTRLPCTTTTYGYDYDLRLRLMYAATTTTPTTTRPRPRPRPRLRPLPRAQPQPQPQPQPEPSAAARWRGCEYPRTAWCSLRAAPTSRPCSARACARARITQAYSMRRPTVRGAVCGHGGPPKTARRRVRAASDVLTPCEPQFDGSAPHT